MKKNITITIIFMLLVAITLFIVFKIKNVQAVKINDRQKCEQGSYDACIKVLINNKALVSWAIAQNVKANILIEKSLSGTDFKFNLEKLR